MKKTLDYKITLPIFVLLLISGFIKEDFFDYGFYTFLRIVVCGYFIYKCFTYKPSDISNVPLNFIVSAAFAILFNPLILIKLEFETWQIIDLLTACYLCYLEYTKIIIRINRFMVSQINENREEIKTTLFIIFCILFTVFALIFISKYITKSSYHENSQTPKEYLNTQNKKCSCWIANYVYRPHEKPRIFSYVAQQNGKETLKDVTNWVIEDIKTGAETPITCEDQSAHLEATAPDGSKLDIHGCQIPTEYELSEIFYVMMIRRPQIEHKYTNSKKQPPSIKAVTIPKHHPIRKPTTKPTPPQDDEPAAKPILSIFGRTLWGM